MDYLYSKMLQQIIASLKTVIPDEEKEKLLQYEKILSSDEYSYYEDYFYRKIRVIASFAPLEDRVKLKDFLFENFSYFLDDENKKDIEKYFQLARELKNKKKS